MVLLTPAGSRQSPVGGQGRGDKRFWSYTMVSILSALCLLLSADLAGAEEKGYKINVEGMHCKTCIYRVTKSLKKLPQVKDVEVSLEKGTVVVRLKDGEDVTPEALAEAIEDSGYKPTWVEEIGAGEGQEPANIRQE